MAGQTVFAFLDGLESKQLDELYRAQWAALAVVQSLQGVAKLLVLRLVPLTTPITEGFVMAWFRGGDAQAAAGEALAQLIRLRLVKRSPRPVSAVSKEGLVTQERALLLSKSVRAAMVEGLAAPGAAPFQTAAGEWEGAGAAAEEHAAATWEGVMAYLVGSAAATVPTPSVLSVLVATGLLAPGKPDGGDHGFGVVAPTSAAPAAPAAGAGDAAGAPEEQMLAAREGVYASVRAARSVHMTQAGFRFLLADTPAQLWTFVGEYIRSATAASPALTAPTILGFLFQLGFCAPGVAYDTAPLPHTAQLILADLGAFGLVHLLPGGSAFVPTSLALALVSGGRSGGGGAVPTPAARDLSVVVEKNMRLYAYTSSPLAVDLLRLFARVDAVLPNLVTATLTRSSVGAALDAGVGAAEVVHFLAARPHEAAAAAGLGIPENVSDALHAWEAERHRATMTQAIMLDAFAPNGEYEALAAFLGGPDAPSRPLVADEEEQLLVVRLDALPAIKAFIQRRRQAQ